MKKMLNIILKYKFALVLLLCDLCLLQFRPDLGTTSLTLTWKYVLEMLSVIPPIFIIMGLIDAWIPKEMMIKYMGKGAGLKGGLLAFLLGGFFLWSALCRFSYCWYADQKRGFTCKCYLISRCMVNNQNSDDVI